MEISLNSFFDAIESKHCATALAIANCYDGDKTVEYYCRLADSYSQVNRYQSSLEIFRVLSEIDTDERGYWYLIATASVQRRMGLYSDGQSSFRKAIELEPDDATARIMLGAMQARFGFITEAELTHREATGCSEGYIDEAWYNLALVLRAQGKFEEARESCLRALEICESESVRNALSDIEEGIRFRQEHSTLLRKVMSGSDPIAKANWLQLVRSTANEDQVCKSIVLSKVDIEHLPVNTGDDQFWRDLEYVENLWSVSVYADATRFFQRLCAGNEDDRWYGFAQSGRMNVCLHRFDQAEKDFRAAYQEDLEDTWALEQLADMFVVSGQLEKAEQVCLEAMAVSSQCDAFVAYNLGRAYRGQCRFEEAMTAFRDADGFRDSEASIADLERAIEIVGGQSF